MAFLQFNKKWNWKTNKKIKKSNNYELLGTDWATRAHARRSRKHCKACAKHAHAPPPRARTRLHGFYQLIYIFKPSEYYQPGETWRIKLVWALSDFRAEFLVFTILILIIEDVAGKDKGVWSEVVAITGTWSCRPSFHTKERLKKARRLIGGKWAGSFYVYIFDFFDFINHSSWVELYY